MALFFLTSRAGAFGSRLTTFFRTIVVGIIGIGLAGLSALQNLASDIGWISVWIGSFTTATRHSGTVHHYFVAWKCPST